MTSLRKIVKAHTTLENEQLLQAEDSVSVTVKLVK